MQVVRRSPRESGFTLLELMVTMAIAASLLGLGAGVFLSMGRRSATQTALMTLQGIIVNARTVSSRYPSAVLVDPTPDHQMIQALTQEVVQELHFDARPIPGQAEPLVPTGIEGRECEWPGMRVDPAAGRVGGALRVDGGMVNCGAYPAYDVTDGLRIELWIRPEAMGTGDLVKKGDSFAVRFEGTAASGGRIAVRLGLEDEKGGVDKLQGSWTVPPIRAGSWLGIVVAYDRRELTLSLDEGYGPVERSPSWPDSQGRRIARSSQDSLYVGGFTGWLDDFRFSGVHAGEAVPMPEGVTLVGKDRRTIRFVDGRLDPAVHAGTERIALKSVGGLVSTLAISPNGMLVLESEVGESEAQPGSKDEQKGVAPPKKE